MRGPLSRGPPKKPHDQSSASRRGLRSVHKAGIWISEGLTQAGS